MYIFDAHGDAQTFDEENENVNSKKYEKDMIAMMMETFVLLRKDDTRNFRCIKCEQRNH